MKRSGSGQARGRKQCKSYGKAPQRRQNHFDSASKVQV